MRSLGLFISFDSSIVSFVSAKTDLSGWEVETGENKLLIYDDKYAKPISGTKTIATITFKVNSNVAEGTKLEILIKDAYVTDGTNDSVFGNISYSVTVARPLSGNANLGTLSVAEGALNPAFKPGTTTYDIGEVEYSVKSLGITCTTEDENATFAIKDNSLKVGENTVSITVTAENVFND